MVTVPRIRVCRAIQSMVIDISHYPGSRFRRIGAEEPATNGMKRGYPAMVGPNMIGRYQLLASSLGSTLLGE